MPVAADNLSCHENKATNAHTCFSTTRLREVDGIRQAPLFTGGPNRLRDTGFSIHVNCRSGVVHLKDRDGVSFAGGTGNETEAITSMKQWMCAANLAKKK